MAQESDDRGPCDLRKELSMYDADFPKDDPVWGENAVVTPRAFLSEYGYDLPGERVPGRFAGFVREHLDSITHVISLVRSFGPVEGFRKRSDPDELSRMLSKDGYNAVEIYRLDAPTDGDTTMIERYASGGFLVKYAYCRGEERRKAAGHDRFGIYHLDIQGVSQLLKKLLCGADEGPWADDESRRPGYLSAKEWEREPNPAGHETWAVAYLAQDELNASLGELARENLLFEECADSSGSGPFVADSDNTASA
jgi:hypothetical protein